MLTSPTTNHCKVLKTYCRFYSYTHMHRITLQPTASQQCTSVGMHLLTDSTFFLRCISQVREDSTWTRPCFRRYSTEHSSLTPLVRKRYLNSIRVLNIGQPEHPVHVRVALLATARPSTSLLPPKVLLGAAHPAGPTHAPRSARWLLTFCLALSALDSRHLLITREKRKRTQVG